MTAKEHRAATKAILRNDALSDCARFLWLLIESYCDQDGTNATPSLDTLAKRCGHKRDWVCRYRNELKTAGLLTWDTVQKGEGFPVCCYRVIYPSSVPLNGTHACAPVNGTHMCPPKRDSTGESLPVRSKTHRKNLIPHDPPCPHCGAPLSQCPTNRLLQ